jgi:hypothetical protein
MTLQYFTLQDNQYVADCMPFFHDGVFRLFYLVDKGHHTDLKGLGGHQWAQASSRDLVHWEHHGLAIAITQEGEGSICTGSVFFHEGTYYAFYATRMSDRTEHLSLATSRDGIHFEKTDQCNLGRAAAEAGRPGQSRTMDCVPNPFASPPPGYRPRDYRDPHVFLGDDGLFHLLVTAWLERSPVAGRGGCLGHLVSGDLKNWEQRDPFFAPGLPEPPECPECFSWNGWHYLVFSNGGQARYRMSRGPMGPWTRPPVETLDGPASRVMKTASFGAGRRIGVAWLGTRQGNRDDGSFEFGGNALFREIVQHPDGTLGAKFPDEMVPRGAPARAVQIEPWGPGAEVDGRKVRIDARHGLAVAACRGVANNARLKIRVNPLSPLAGFGLRFRANHAGTFDSGYDLNFAPYEAAARLNQQRITTVDGLDRPLDLEIILKDDIIDVCIDGRRTLVDRCPERQGETMLLYGQDGEVAFEIAEMESL